MITPPGQRVLGQWVEAFEKIEQQIAAFTERYEKRG